VKWKGRRWEEEQPDHPQLYHKGALSARHEEPKITKLMIQDFIHLRSKLLPSKQDLVLGSHEHSNEIIGSINGKMFLCQMTY
jgi:hypothetical protein